MTFSLRSYAICGVLAFIVGAGLARAQEMGGARGFGAIDAVTGTFSGAVQLLSTLDVRGAIANGGASNGGLVYVEDSAGFQVHNGTRSALKITTPSSDTWAEFNGATNSTQIYTTTAPMMLYGSSASGSALVGANADAVVTAVAFAAVDNAGAGGVNANKLMAVYGGGALGFPQVQTCSGTTTGTCDPQSRRIEATCSSACAMTMQETSAVLGQEFCLTNVGSNTITLADVVNVFVAPAFVDTTGLGTNDSFCARYVTGNFWLVYSHEDI